MARTRDGSDRATIILFLGQERLSLFSTQPSVCFSTVYLSSSQSFHDDRAIFFSSFTVSRDPCTVAVVFPTSVSGGHTCK